MTVVISEFKKNVIFDFKNKTCPQTVKMQTCLTFTGISAYMKRESLVPLRFQTFSGF